MRMKYFLVLCGSLLVLAACNKDKFQTKPQIDSVKAEGNFVPLSGTLGVTMKYTDKEGDVDSFYVIRQRLNQKGPVTTRLAYKVPVKNETQGDISLTLSYQSDLILNLPILGGTVKESDTLRLSFILKDKAGNRSDTARLNGTVVVFRK
jgi:hypothetical protein